MENTIDILCRCPLFAGMNENQITEVLNGHWAEVRNYDPGKRIFDEEDVPKNIYVLLSGSIAVARESFGGKRMILTRITRAGGVFGEIYAYIDRPRYDMYAEAVEKSRILAVNTAFFKMKSPEGEMMVHNQMAIFAEKAYAMNRRLRVLTAPTLREKVARLLAESPGGRVNLPREEMADYLGVARPSLSRELSRMAGEGLIAIDGREISAADGTKLEEYL